MIIVDSREKNVEQYFKATDTPYEIQTLETGDYTNENMDFLVERKKSFDMSQSLTNNQLVYELSKMIELHPDVPRYLIFEGDYDALIEVQQMPGLRGLLTAFPLKLAHIYGVHFIKTSDTIETIQVLNQLDKYAKNIKDDKSAFKPLHMTGEKDERVRNLMTVPRLGLKKAKEVIERYGSIKQLVETLEEDPDSVMEIDGIGETLVKKMQEIYLSETPIIKKKKEGKKVDHARQRAIYESKTV